MGKRQFVLFTAIMLIAAGAAASVLYLASPDSTWMAFLGWIVFFFSLQFPFLFYLRFDPRGREETQRYLRWFERLLGLRKFGH